jgi:hypothetical protein
MKQTKKPINQGSENNDKLRHHEEKFYDRVAQCELRLRHLEIHEALNRNLPEEQKKTLRHTYSQDLRNIMEKLKNHLAEYCKHLDLKIKKEKNKKEKNKLLKNKDNAKKTTEKLKAKIKEKM